MVVKHMIYTGSVRVLENMVLRLLDKLTAKDIREGGLSSRSLASALAEMHMLGDKLIAWTELQVPISIMCNMIGCSAVPYADLVWAVWCCGEGENVAGNDNVIEVPAHKSKAEADREAFLKHPFGIAVTTTPAGKELQACSREQLIRRKEEGEAEAAFNRAEEER